MIMIWIILRKLVLKAGAEMFQTTASCQNLVDRKICKGGKNPAPTLPKFVGTNDCTRISK
jgi:hypothetical protein